jgi:hypothetical protein
MIGRNVRAGLHGQHGEGIADIIGLSPKAGDREDRFADLAK